MNLNQHLMFDEKKIKPKKFQQENNYLRKYFQFKEF